MTFAEAAETVLRDAQRAMKPAEIWAEIERRSLATTEGKTPVATLAVQLLRKCANSSVGRTDARPRFYKRGDGAFGLLADLTPEQQHAVRKTASAPARDFTGREFRQDRAGMRERPEVARQILERVVPDEAPRRAVASLFADLIKAAHEVGAHTWKLTLGIRSLRLTVGRAILATLERDSLWFVADLTRLGDDDRALIDGLTTADLKTTPYRSLPDVTFHYAAPDVVSDCASAIRAAVTGAMPAAAEGVASVVAGTRFHSAGAVEMLEQLTGTSLPRPEYEGYDEDDDEDLSLDELLAEFVETYAARPDGLEFLARYEQERAAAQANWNRITELAQRGEDVTNAVLDGTLPHSGTANHRARGAWSFHAPVILGNVRLFFEKAKWVKPGDWPPVAQTLLSFYRACFTEPGSLAAHIERFDANPLSKGFGIGTLTPFLSAIAPDAFPLVNKKVLDVLNYFAGTELEALLASYPSAIEAIDAVVERHAALRDPRLAGLRPGDVFDHFCHWLISIRGFPFPEVEAPPTSAQTFWKISPGKGAELWDRWQTLGVAEIGWNSLGDLSEVREENEFRARVDEANAVGKDYKLAGSRQAWNLSRLPVGTLLVANRGTSEVVGLGRVKGPYRYVEGSEFKHQIPVEWFDTRIRAVDQPGWIKTLMELDRATFEEIAALEGPPGPTPGPGLVMAPPPPPAPSYTREQFIAETGLDEDTAARWLRVLQDKKQVIIQGPPGTGKTYVAERLAKLLTRGATDRVELVQFHPAYAYEDFIQGIRPTETSGALTFALEPGRFSTFCARAAAAAPALSVLIIDEINRANLPRVFGELMYLLEYREKRVELASGGSLTIPGNVHIIGTMNTADRSIARLDHALRRRFSFLRLQPKHDVLRAKCELDEDVVEALIGVLAKINEAIGDANFELGISYFLRQNIENILDDVWQGEIEPYLEEYFYDQPKVVAPFRWTALAAGPLSKWSRQG